jgi:excinuclease ABC subunit A
VRGARTHNLKNIDLDIPRNQLVVITGLSGSGKSSLAFDTLYAEGQRRYVESLSAYARQFLQLMDKPDVDLIEGLSPAIAIEQKATSHNPRSTVGTVTEIHDYLRLLFARAGTPYCPDHGCRWQAQTVSQMVDAVLALPEAHKLMILAPVAREKKGEFAELFADMQAQGYVRFRVDGQVARGRQPAQAEEDREARHRRGDRPRQGADTTPAATAEADLQQRLAESFEAALRLADGRAIALAMDWTPGRSTCSAQVRLPGVQLLAGRAGAAPVLVQLARWVPARPATAWATRSSTRRAWWPSHRSAWPAAPSRAGTGATPTTSRCSKAWRGTTASTSTRPSSRWRPVQQPSAARLGRGPTSSSLRDLDSAAQAQEGQPRSTLRGHPAQHGAALPRDRLGGGARGAGALPQPQPCPDCGGTRLRREARHVKVGEGAQARAIYEVEPRHAGEAQAYFDALQLTGAKAEIADKVVREIGSRLQFLNDVGLNYLSLDRSADTLSGGEAQRIRLASQIGSGLTGVMYVLDEPSIGLHQRDNDRLIGTLQAPARPRQQRAGGRARRGHDPRRRPRDRHGPRRRRARRARDGPGHAGARWRPTPHRLTGRYLSGKRTRIAVPRMRHALCRPRPTDRSACCIVRNARGNNLKGVTVDFPGGPVHLRDRRVRLGQEHAGQRHAVRRRGAQALPRHAEPAAHEEIEGLEHFDKVINVDQSPIGRTPRSNPATYTGLFTPIRELFAEVPTARERGYGPGASASTWPAGAARPARATAW